MNEMLGLLNAIAGLVGAVGGLILATLAIIQWKGALRWKQAEEGRKVLDDLFLGEKHGGYDALVMTDLPEGIKEKFEDKRYKDLPERKVSHKEVIEALGKAVRDEDPGPIGGYIWACFDDLCFYLDRIGYFLKQGLLTLDDVRSPLDYYAGKMAKQKKVYVDYIHRIRADRALYLLEWLPGWKGTAATPAGSLPGADRPPV